MLRFSMVALTVVAAVVGGTTTPASAKPEGPASQITAETHAEYWTQAAPATAASKVIDGGFNLTYGWAVPNNEAVVTHYPTTTPRLLGYNVNHFYGKPFMRAVFTFVGGMPSYRLQYVNRANAGGCSGTHLDGRRFLRIIFEPAVYVGERPVGEILVVDEESVETAALTCVTGNRAKVGFGLTGRTEVRTGDLSVIDPDGNRLYVAALDFRDP